MFRVPANAEMPTFDHTFKVGFWRWLVSKSHEREEWMRRRNAAAKLAKQNQNQRAAEWRAQKEAERDARRGR